MKPIPSTSNEKNDSFQPGPIEEPEKLSNAKKSSKTRKPARPADRAPASTAPQMKSLSTSSDPHVSNFKGDSKKSSVTSAEQVQPDQNLASTKIIKRDEKFVARKLKEIHMHQYLDYQELKAIKNQLYEMALSANDSGIKLIVEFATQHSELRRFFANLGYRAIGEGNAGLFTSIKAHAPNALFNDGIPAVLKALTKPGATESEIQNALSIIKILLKDGVDCSKEQAQILSQWAQQQGDQELLELFVRD